MFKYWSRKCTVFYFIFVIHFSLVCHTVVNSSDAVHLHKNESLHSDDSIEQIKREDKKPDSIKNENKSKDVNTSENKVVSSGIINNATVHSNILPVEDEFNSTASLPKWMLNIKDGALLRTGYVALGFMSIVLIFFVVRAVRLRQKRSKSRKYGIITSTASDMEMEPLDKDDDEEEDTTLFDAQHKYTLQ